MVKEDFIFDGEKLSDYGYIICSFDSSNNLENFVVSEINFSEIKSPLSDTSHITSTEYNDNLSKTIQITKINCEEHEINITDDDISILTKWLCRKNYKWFNWVNKEIYYEVKINLKKIELKDICVGLELDIISNRPYALTKEIVITETLTNSNNLLVNINNDDEGYTYPDIQITINEAGNLILTNQFENRITRVNNCSIGEIITFVGGDTLQIISNNEGHDLSSDFNYNFVRLCNYYGNSNNTLKSTLSCDITMTYREKRKVGI